MMENADATSAMLYRLRGLGVQLSMDCFGTGYTSLSSLHRFPVNMLKVDKSFVGKVAVSKESWEIVRAIIQLAVNLGMDPVAEGVSLEEQYRQLKQLNCGFAQGDLFAKALAADQVQQVIQKPPGVMG
jgi:EAL domain-containing protein (putative c-di-GMP-specific phosphodiesterase class I)